MPDETGQERNWRLLAGQMASLVDESARIAAVERRDGAPFDDPLNAKVAHRINKAMSEFPVLVQDRWAWRLAYEHMRNTAIKKIGVITEELASTATLESKDPQRIYAAKQKCDEALHTLLELTKVLEPETYHDDLDRRWLREGSSFPEHVKDRSET